MTSTAHLEILDRSVEKANLWITEVAAGLETGDRHEAYRVLRAFLHVLRDRLPVLEAAQLAAQLPLLIRGVFYEGWQPARARCATATRSSSSIASRTRRCCMATRRRRSRSRRRPACWCVT